MIDVGATIDELHGLAVAAEQQVSDRLVREWVRERFPLLSNGLVSEIVDGVIARLVGLGPLETLLEAPDVSDVLVNGPGLVWVERLGNLEPSELSLSEEEIVHAIQRIVAPLGIRADRRRPLVDARLADGSRVHAVLAPLAIDGPYLAIRRFRIATPSLAQWCPEAAGELLRWMVDAEWNLLVSGATGSGKTTMLNTLAGLMASDVRVITIEDAAELRLPGAHVVRLETRSSTSEGVGEIGVRELLRNALRMRPDRLILGEVRGAEALDLLQALNTGHDGSMSTIHANSSADALVRLETLAMFAAEQVPIEAIRSQVLAAVDAIVHVRRAGDGSREVAAIEEVSADGGTRSLYRVGEDCRRPERSARRPGALAL